MKIDMRPVKKLLRERKMSAYRLGLTIGMDRSQLSKTLRNKGGEPERRTLKRIADGLGMDYAEFIRIVDKDLR